MQRIIVTAALAAGLTALDARAAIAQWNLARQDSSRTWVYGSFGLDPAFVASMGIARSVSRLDDTQISAEAGWVVARLDPSDYRGRVAVRTPVLRWGSVRLAADWAVIARGTSNSIYRAFGMGAASTWTLGVYRQRWFAATEGGVDKEVATHLTHTDWYRRYMDPGVKDGWYGNTGGTVHFGLTSGIAVRHAELTARAGILRTDQFNDVIPPFYGSIGVGYQVP